MPGSVVGMVGVKTWMVPALSKMHLVTSMKKAPVLVVLGTEWELKIQL